MAAVEMRMWMPSTWLEPLRVLDHGLRGQVIRPVALLASTAALAVAVPVVLLARAGGHPMAQVWIVAVTVCAYAFLLLLCIWRSWPFYIDLVCVSYGLLLAAAAAHVGPRAAAIALHLATLYAAARLGYALAEHRLRAGTERGAARPVPHPDPEEEGRAMALMSLAMTAFWTAVMAVILYVSDMGPDVETERLDELMTVFLPSYAGGLTHVMAWMNHGGQPQWMPEFLVPCVILCPIVGVVAGWLGAALSQWLLLLGLTASLGYRAAVNLHPPRHPAAAADGVDD